MKMQFCYFIGDLSGKRVASLQLSIEKIQARVGSRHWRFKKCGYKKITLVTCSIVRVQCFVAVLFSTHWKVNLSY